MSDLYNKIFSRNSGLITVAEQEKLRQSCVGIAGLGSVGGLLAERLIRLGIGRLKIMDPEDFEPTNLNRQICSSMDTIGRNKAEVVYSNLKGINPEARIEYSKNGVETEEDAKSLVDECDVVVDEMSFGLLRESILLQRVARRKGIYYIFAIGVGFGAVSVIFNPIGLTLEEYNQLPVDVDHNKINELIIPVERALPIMPSYVSNIPSSTIQEIASGKRPIPCTSVGAGLASIMTANEIMNIVLKKREIITAPRYSYIDLIDQRFIIGTVLQDVEIKAKM